MLCKSNTDLFLIAIFKLERKCSLFRVKGYLQPNVTQVVWRRGSGFRIKYFMEKPTKPKFCYLQIFFIKKFSVFPQNFHTRKLGEITVLYAVFDTEVIKEFESHITDLNLSLFLEAFLVSKPFDISILNIYV